MTEKRFEEDRYIIRNLAVYDTYKRIFITPKLSTKRECEIIIMHLNYHKDIISTKNNQIDYLYNHYNKIKKENEELKERIDVLNDQITCLGISISILLLCIVFKTITG